jgi:hypothetical protein
MFTLIAIFVISVIDLVADSLLRACYRENVNIRCALYLSYTIHCLLVT